METQELLNQLIEMVSSYDAGSISDIYRAYDYASRVHGNQRRKSGELYIVHPLNVAIILASLQADWEVICAALLHDVIEDGDCVTKSEIEREFNKDIAFLVDGVTKMKRELFADKSAQNYANVRKLLRGIMVDPRIIMIKISDRLHNMRTLMYLSRNKQIENSIETLEIFVPLAERVGLHQLKNELTDLSFQYLNYDVYHFIQEKREKIAASSFQLLEDTKDFVHDNLNRQYIENDVSYRIKSVYAIYEKLFNYSIRPSEMMNLKMEDIHFSDSLEKKIHDMRSLKILVSGLGNCYFSKEIIKEQFRVVSGKEKDCIQNPKTNGYQSLHTTIYGSDGLPIQTKIRTFEMEKFAINGLAEYWKKFGDQASLKMKEKLQEDYPFYQSLRKLDTILESDEEFVNRVKEEVLSNMIYPHTKDGKTIELPFGATPVDFAFQAFPDTEKQGILALVNGKYVPLNYQLNSKDVVEIIPIKGEWMVDSLSSYAATTGAKAKIRSKQMGV